MLPFQDILARAAPLQLQAPPSISHDSYNAPARPAPKTLPSPVSNTPLGCRCADQAHAAGLLTKAIYGNEHKNRYLLETPPTPR